jgi:hypothetical protein
VYGAVLLSVINEPDFHLKGPERENWIRAKYIARAFVRIDALNVDADQYQGEKSIRDPMI